MMSLESAVFQPFSANRQKRKSRIEQARWSEILSFRKRQDKLRELISVAEIVGILVLRDNPAVIGNAKSAKEAAVRICQLITALAIHEQLPAAFRTDPKYRIRRSWLKQPNQAPAEAFLTAEQLRDICDNHGIEIAALHFWECWLPVTDAANLLRTKGVAPLPVWGLDASTAVVEPIDTQEIRNAEKAEPGIVKRTLNEDASNEQVSEKITAAVAPAMRSRGRPNETMLRVAAQMRADLTAKTITPEGLRLKKQKELASDYKAGKTSCKKARDLVLN
jgi:hypothetical protein